MKYSPIEFMQRAAREILRWHTNCVSFLSHRYIANETSLCDDRSVALASGRSRKYFLWKPTLNREIKCARDATRFMIDILRSQPDIRDRFPKALSEGGDGKFAKWLQREAIANYGFAQDATKFINDAFIEEPSTRAKQAMLFQHKLRKTYPLLFLPVCRRTLIKHLFDLVHDAYISHESAWWCLLEMAEQPNLTLLWTWQHTPEWQDKFPDGITRFGRKRFAAWIKQTYEVKDVEWLNTDLWPDIFQPADQIRLTYNANSVWQKDFPRISLDELTCIRFIEHITEADSSLDVDVRLWLKSLNKNEIIQQLLAPGVNVFGHFAYPSGLRTSTKSIISGLSQLGFRLTQRNVRTSLRNEAPSGSMQADPELFDISIIHVQPEPYFTQLRQRANLAPRTTPPPYQIGYWYWEFDTIPPAWDRAAEACDEIWTATEFIAQGLRARYNKPVHALLPGAEIPAFTHLPRSHYGLPENTFIFLFVFSANSIIERKNPLGLIHAFKRAFDITDHAMLVLKTSFGESSPQQMHQLTQEAGYANIRIIDEVYSTEETLNLMRIADAYVSLHRSEGLGLTMAEAMLLGKPTIGTRFSGNLDFMNDQNSLLVDFKLVTLQNDVPPYSAGMKWAEPSEEHAAVLMRRLYLDRDFARDLGARAQSSLQQQLNYAETGRRMDRRLKEIMKERASRHLHVNH